MKVLDLLFTLSGRVSRSQYLVAGFGLAILKYAIDAGGYFLLTGGFWSPFDYLDSSLLNRMQGDLLPTPYLFFLFFWSLIFLWIGVGMSSRRARDAGFSPWLGLAFLLPLINYLAVLLLASARPDEGPLRYGAEARTQTPGRGDLSFTLCGGVAIAAAIALTGLMTEVLHYYGTALFLGLPFALGAVMGYLLNRRTRRRVGVTVGMVTVVLGVSSLALLAFALEGAICLVMAYPVLWAAAVPGALFGRSLARIDVAPDMTLGAIVLMFPLGSFLEKGVTEPGQREVITSIEVGAPPEMVWKHVVSFSEIPPPEHWMFGTGIAYPVRARIVGEGVGAVRRCEFSTGAFVEPITVWDEPRRLSFDVVEQPIPMEEWSFYSQLHPPHLAESFRSLRGEFRLTPTAAGTLLEGSTWYVVDMGPAAYWGVWGDAILHRIHLRVLEHVQRLAEAEARERGGKR